MEPRGVVVGTGEGVVMVGGEGEGEGRTLVIHYGVAVSSPLTIYMS